MKPAEPDGAFLYWHLGRWVVVDREVLDAFIGCVAQALACLEDPGPILESARPGGLPYGTRTGELAGIQHHAMQALLEDLSGRTGDLVYYRNQPVSLHSPEQTEST